MAIDKEENPSRASTDSTEVEDQSHEHRYDWQDAVDKQSYLKNVRRIRRKKFTELGRDHSDRVSLKDLSHIQVSRIDDPRVRMLLGMIDEQLASEGLNRDESQEVAFSEIFPISQSKDDKKAQFSSDMKDMESFLANITDETNEIAEINPHANFDLPMLSTPEIHNLMRGRPKDIYEKIARLMVETHFFDHHPELIDFLPTAYFFSKRVDSVEVFDCIKTDLEWNKRYHLLRVDYSFDQFQKEIPKLKRVIDSTLESYFCTIWIKAAARDYLHDQENFNEENLQNLISSFWNRYNNTWDSLTAKQRHAVSEVYMYGDSVLWEEAAKNLRISFESFRDRIEGAFRKFKLAFPELGQLKRKLSYREIHKQNNLQKDLFDHNKAKIIAPLFRINLETGAKTKIESSLGDPKEKPNLDDWKRQSIKALAETNVPVPDILDCDFFGGLFPEMHFQRLKGESAFIGHGPSNIKLLKRLREEGRERSSGSE